MHRRRLRFIDTDPLHRTYTEPNPFATQSIPSFPSIQSQLAEEQSKSQVYAQIWTQAYQEYQQKKATLPSDYFSPTTPFECYTAVIAYTTSTEVVVDGQPLQLYREFNRNYRQLTDAASWDAFGYKTMYYLLSLAVPGIKNVPSTDRYLYRGIKGYHFDPVPTVGDYFFFDYFASTTVDRAMAEEYLGSDGTLVEMQDGATVAMGISKYSHAEDEQEVLVLPRSRFKVVGFEQGEGVDRVVLAKAGAI